MKIGASIMALDSMMSVRVGWMRTVQMTIPFSVKSMRSLIICL